MKPLQLIGILVGSLILAGCGDAPVAPDPAGNAAENIVRDYRVGVDDRLQISVWQNPEVSVTAVVRPDGKISVPLIGDVEVAGRTPSEVAEIVKRQLSAYIRAPNVAVIVLEMRSYEFQSRVRVTGAVRTPTSIPFREGMTVLDVILQAGGVNDFASPNRTKLYRRAKDRTQVFEIELGDILNKGQLETNLNVRPGDVITVPERLF
jgi:polysaccharide biosynthesis/export protein